MSEPKRHNPARIVVQIDFDHDEYANAYLDLRPHVLLQEVMQSIPSDQYPLESFDQLTVRISVDHGGDEQSVCFTSHQDSQKIANKRELRALRLKQRARIS